MWRGGSSSGRTVQASGRLGRLVWQSYRRRLEHAYFGVKIVYDARMRGAQAGRKEAVFPSHPLPTLRLGNGKGWAVGTADI
jgi:hypothetical protein